MDNPESHYFDNGGLFLAALNDGSLIGSGAIRKLDTTTAELKRIWLLEAYHGRGIGYKLVTLLFNFAHDRAYQVVRLQTSPQQMRALAFYKKIGFKEILCYNDDKEAVSMEIALKGTK